MIEKMDNNRRKVVGGLTAGAIGWMLAGCGGGGSSAGVSMTPVQKSVAVSDGVKLNYLEAGQGKTLLMIPGWSQTAEQFRFQIAGLSAQYRVIAVDMRGHGDSDKPAFGYSIERLAKDLHDFMAALQLSDVTVLGHSMGCSVLWCHYDLFGAENIARYVFCDQSSFLTTDPAWTNEQKADYGSLFTPNAVSSTTDTLAGPADAAYTATVNFLKSMVTSAMPADQFNWIVSLNLKMPRTYAASMLYNHCQQDWRDVLPRISLPALFIGGDLSIVPVSCMKWNASQIANANLQIFSASDKGSHFMFIENPTKFNALVSNFMG